MVDRTVSEAASLTPQKTHPSQWMVYLIEDLLASRGDQEVMSASLLKQAEAEYAHLPLGYDPPKANPTVQHAQVPMDCNFTRGPVVFRSIPSQSAIR